MDKHLLVTLGADQTSSLSLRFVRGFFADSRGVKLTLLFVAPRRYDETSEPELCVEYPEDSVMTCSPVNPEVHCAACQAILDTGRQWLMDMGFPSGNVFTKLIPNRRGTVGDIVSEARRGMYDAVVLGRRGLSWFDEVFDDSVSHKILWEEIDFPVWICREPKPARQSVLLCVDGSEQSMRMADHVGYILRGEPRHKAVIFHIDTGSGDGEDAIDAAREVLLANRIEEDRIKVATARSKDPAKAILSEAARGGYAAVAVGRRTGRPKGLSRIIGPVSLKLLRGLGGAALWLCK